MELQSNKPVRAPVLHIQRQPYVKVEFRVIRRAFKEHALGRNERDLYRAMAYFVDDHNSDEISCSIPELCEETMMSDKPLKKALKALQEKNFISKLSKVRSKGRYRLNIGIFYGLREKQQLVDNSPPLGVDIPLVLGVDLPLAHVRVYNSSSRSLNKQQHVVVVHFQFGDKSLFSQLNPEWLSQLAEDYGQETIQGIITRLEETYRHERQVKTSLEALIISSLKNKSFDSKTLDQKRIEKNESQEIQKEEDERLSDIAFKREKDTTAQEWDEIFETIQADEPQLIKNERAILELKDPVYAKAHPDIIEIRTRHNAIQKYKSLKETI